jgi:HEAT repeat protein/energy-coupling factor transporter ATP-binding protein EcfA2
VSIRGTNNATVKIFDCYAQEDKILRDQLEIHLSALRQQKRIISWSVQETVPGMETEKEALLHLGSAQIVLLLISSHFLASKHCSTIMEQALKQYRERQVVVIPILLRPVDWEDTLFKDLKVLPGNATPVTLWPNLDEAFLDVVRGIRQAIESLPGWLMRKNEETDILCQQYREKLYEQWKMLDFKGIQYSDINRSVSIPLAEVFVFPDVLRGTPEHETLEREYRQDQRKVLRKDSNRLIESQQPADQKYQSQRKAPKIAQRDDFHTVLTRSPRLVILGDPGAGKSTLLRYLLLILTESSDRFRKEFPQIVSGASVISPLYIPLAAFADTWLSSPLEERSLKDFLPKLLRYTYLDAYTLALEAQLEKGELFILLDGLDEIPDISIRLQIVRQIENFTQAYPKNRFIVTSRIVGYKDAPIAAEYQTFTLADFHDEQIKSFIQKWCPAYERWVNQVHDSQILHAAGTKEAEKLFLAIRHNEGVRRLAVNPLLLTILALVQRQGIELPGHRVELFDQCSTTLLETWLRTKESSRIAPHHVRISKQNLRKILLSLAFWMHSSFGAIPEEEVLEQVAKQVLGKLTRDEDEAQHFAAEFLDIVRGRAGILVEQGRHRYGFLHLTFQEFFAAGELVIKKERDTFIKRHLHDPRWNIVILLAIGIIGILHWDAEKVTEIVQETILKAQSPFEKWLHRDLLFAGYCLADDVGVSIVCEEAIICNILYLYVTSPYNSLRASFSTLLLTWRETPLATKACALLLHLDYAQETFDHILPTDFKTAKSLVSVHQLEQNIAQYYNHLIQMHLKSSIILVRLRIFMILCKLGLGEESWVEDILTALENSDWTVRQAAVEALVWSRSKQPRVINAIIKVLEDSDWTLRQIAISALSQLGSGHPQVIDTLLLQLADPEPEVRQAIATALGQLIGEHPQVIDTLLLQLADPEPEVRHAIAEALGRLAGEHPQVIDTLLLQLTDPEPEVRQAVATALGRLAGEHPQVIDALLLDLTDDEPKVRQAVAKSLGRLGAGQWRVIEALIQAIGDDNWKVRQAAVEALGLSGNARLEVIEVLIRAIDTDIEVQQAAVSALGRVGNGYPQVIDALLHLLTHEDIEVQQAAIGALGRVGNGYPQVIDALLHLLTHEDSEVQQAAANALGLLESKQTEVIDALIQMLIDSPSSARLAAASALERLGSKYTEVVNYLLSVLSDTYSYSSLYEQRMIEQKQEISRILSMRKISLLGLLGSGQEAVVETLLQTLTETDPDIRYATAIALGQLKKGSSEVIKALLEMLTDSSSYVRQAVASSLGLLGNPSSTIIEALLLLMYSKPQHNPSAS